MWSNILVIILEMFVCSVSGQGFCDDKTPLKTIFTLKNVTYVVKGEMVYRTPVGQPVGSKAKGINFRYLFNKGLSVYNFDSIDTGFLITDNPYCNSIQPKELKDFCEKLPQKAFIIGKIKGEQVYRVYHLAYILGNFPAFTLSEPLGTHEQQGKFYGEFWPIILQLDDAKILHSVYDERTRTVNLIIHHKLKISRFYCEFVKNMDYPLSYSSVDILHGKEELIIKGFFSMPFNRSTDPHKNLFGVAKSLYETEDELLVFEVDKDFNFKNQSIGQNNSITIDDIFGCESTVTMTVTGPVLNQTISQVSSSLSTGEVQPSISISTDTISTIGATTPDSKASIGSSVDNLLLFVFIINLFNFIYLCN